MRDPGVGRRPGYFLPVDQDGQRQPGDLQAFTGMPDSWERHVPDKAARTKRAAQKKKPGKPGFKRTGNEQPQAGA
jgi:hypothetical protein